MMRLAIGPADHTASWEWVGAGTAPELAKYYEVAFFADFASLPTADLIVAIKQPPSIAALDVIHASGGRVIYVPIDYYHSTEAIVADAKMLRSVDLVLVHSEVLRPHLAPYTRRIGFVEHHSRDALPDLAAYKREGFVLWVGACENLPHLMRWVEENSPPFEIQLLTNLNNRQSRVSAHFRAHDIGVRLKFTDDSVNGLKVFAWSKDTQESMMRACRGAMDIKGNNFNQSTKPPTKGQQFVASGIPFGCNTDSSTAAYFADRGFALAEPCDAERLLSRGYFDETRAFATSLSEWTSLATVGRAYHAHFQSLLGSEDLVSAQSGATACAGHED
jgi:hypothetical protein